MKNLQRHHIPFTKWYSQSGGSSIDTKPRFTAENESTVRRTLSFRTREDQGCERNRLTFEAVWQSASSGRSFRETRSTRDCASNQPDVATCLTLKAPVAATHSEPRGKRGHAKVYRYILWAHALARGRHSFQHRGPVSQRTSWRCPRTRWIGTAVKRWKPKRALGSADCEKQRHRCRGNARPTFPIFLISSVFSLALFTDHWNLFCRSKWFVSFFVSRTGTWSTCISAYEKLYP